MPGIVTTPESRGAAVTMAVVLVLAGIVLLVWPGPTTVVLVRVLGLGVLAYGVRELVLAVTGTGERSRLWGAVLGVVTLVGGATIFFTPLLGSITTGLVIGIYWIAGGVLGLIAAVAEPGHRVVRLLLAALSLLAGAVVLAQPGLSLVALVWFAGLWLVASGVVVLIGAFIGGGRRVAAV